MTTSSTPQATPSQLPSAAQLVARVTLASCLVFCSFAICDSGWGPILGPLSTQLHISLSTIGLLYAIWSAGYLPGALSGGFMLDRYGPRSVLFCAAVIILCGWFTLSTGLFFPHMLPIITLFVIMGISGIGGGIIDAGSNALISTLFAHRRGTALSLFTLLYPICGVLIALIDAALLAFFHNNPLPSLLLTLSIIVIALCVLFIIPRSYRLVEAAEHHHQQLSTARHSAVSFLLLLLPAIIIMMFTSGMNSTLRTWTPAYLQVAFTLTPATAAALSSITWALSIMSRLGAAALLIRVGTRRISIICIGIAVVGCVCVLFSPNAFIATLAMALTTIGLSPLFAIAITLGNELVRRSPGAISGILLFSGGCCAVVFSSIFGYLLNTSGPHWPILFSLAMILLSSIGLLMVFKKRN